MDVNNLYLKTEQYVRDLFHDNKKPELFFHNYQHTKKVVERTKEIAGHYYLSEIDMLAVYIATWFHDTGYLFTDPQHHEAKSVALMQAFMEDKAPDKELLEKITDCILATRAPRTHNNLLQEIICDADTYHMGTKEFKESDKRIWDEYNANGTKISENNWAIKTITLLKEHQFYTKYCQDLLEKRKQKNMKKIKNKSGDNEKNGQEINIADIGHDKTGLTTKGIQTMLRMTSGNHLRLSDMADSKANILISVNSIIISVILGVMLRKLEEVPFFTIPTIIFLIVSLATIVISIVATRPKIGSGTFNSQDIVDKKINLLFFGNYYRTSFEEYDKAMREMMIDTDYLYGSLLKDIHTLGAVLGRKYRLIRLAYNIFMIGIIVSVLAFGIAAIFFNSTITGTIPTAKVSPF